MKRVHKQQIKNLFNDFSNTMKQNIWMSGIISNGEKRTYFFNKNIKTKQIYKNYKINGEYYQWSSRGQLLIKTYKKGKYFIKQYDEWHDNGIKKIECFINPDNPLLFIGEYKMWDRTGKLLLNVIFKDNKFNIIINNLPEGIKYFYYPNGAISLIKWENYKKIF